MWPLSRICKFFIYTQFFFSWTIRIRYLCLGRVPSSSYFFNMNARRAYIHTHIRVRDLDSGIVCTHTYVPKYGDFCIIFQSVSTPLRVITCRCHTSVVKPTLVQYQVVTLPVAKEVLTLPFLLSQLATCPVLTRTNQMPFSLHFCFFPVSAPPFVVVSAADRMKLNPIGRHRW
jgi:hypothetical protein